MSAVATPPGITEAAYQQLSDEEKRRLGYQRPLSDQEFAQLTPEQLQNLGFAPKQQGAPAILAGQSTQTPIISSHFRIRTNQRPHACPLASVFSIRTQLGRCQRTSPIRQPLKSRPRHGRWAQVPARMFRHFLLAINWWINRLPMFRHCQQAISSSIQNLHKRKLIPCRAPGRY